VVVWEAWVVKASGCYLSKHFMKGLKKLWFGFNKISEYLGLDMLLGYQQQNHHSSGTGDVSNLFIVSVCVLALDG
jgi:hypothetical protein